MSTLTNKTTTAETDGDTRLIPDASIPPLSDGTLGRSHAKGFFWETPAVQFLVVILWDEAGSVRRTGSDNSGKRHYRKQDVSAMNKNTMITAVAYAYATAAAASFVLGFMLGPRNAMAGEGEIIIRDVPPHTAYRAAPPGQLTVRNRVNTFRLLTDAELLDFGFAHADLL